MKTQYPFSAIIKIKLLVLITFLCLLNSTLSLAQENKNALVLKPILQHYYKTEKPVYKNRSQLLYFYCNQANNNEELFEAVKDNKLPNDFLKEIQLKIANDTAEKDWTKELDYIYTNDKTKLATKVGSCLSLEKFQEISTRQNLNNQRLMIVSKPLYYSKKNIALVKVVFYRNVEHNSSTILLMEKVGNNWVIKDYLNSWST